MHSSVAECVEQGLQHPRGLDFCSSASHDLGAWISAKLLCSGLFSFFTLSLCSSWEAKYQILTKFSSFLVLVSFSVLKKSWFLQISPFQWKCIFLHKLLWKWCGETPSGQMCVLWLIRKREKTPAASSCAPLKQLGKQDTKSCIIH